MSTDDHRLGARGPASKKRKICALDGVRQYGDDGPPELWLNEDGRMVVVAFNEGGHCATQLDLYDLVEWVQSGPGDRTLLDNGSGVARTKFDSARN